MKFLQVAIAGVMTVFFLLCADMVIAQTSPLNSSGDTKTNKQYYADKAAEETARKQNAYKPKPEPVTPAAANASPGNTHIKPAKRPAARPTSIVNMGREYMIAGYSMEPGLIKVTYEGKFGYFNEAGRQIIPVIYESVGEFKDGQVEVKISARQAKYFDRTGNPLPPETYKARQEEAFRANMLASYELGKPKTTAPPPPPPPSQGEIAAKTYETADNTAEGLTRVSKKRFRDVHITTVAEEIFYGYIDEKNGIEIIPLIYDDAGKFTKGLAGVKLGQKWGYIDITGKVIIPIIYDAVFTSWPEPSLVKLNGKFGFIDISGTVTIPIIYDNAGIFSLVNNYARVSLNNKWGTVDKAGNILIPIIYDKLTQTYETPEGYYSMLVAGRIIAESGGKKTYFDITGKKVKK